MSSNHWKSLHEVSRSQGNYKDKIKHIDGVLTYICPKNLDEDLVFDVLKDLAAEHLAIERDREGYIVSFNSENYDQYYVIAKEFDHMYLIDRILDYFYFTGDSTEYLTSIVELNISYLEHFEKLYNFINILDEETLRLNGKNLFKCATLIMYSDPITDYQEVIRVNHGMYIRELLNIIEEKKQKTIY